MTFQKTWPNATKVAIRFPQLMMDNIVPLPASALFLQSTECSSSSSRPAGIYSHQGSPHSYDDLVERSFSTVSLPTQSTYIQVLRLLDLSLQHLWWVAGFSCPPDRGIQIIPKSACLCCSSSADSSAQCASWSGILDRQTDEQAVTAVVCFDMSRRQLLGGIIYLCMLYSRIFPNRHT